MNSRKLKGDVQQAKIELEALRNILDSAGSYVYTKDVDSRYTYANPLTCQLFGASLDEIIGKDDSHFFPPESVAHIQENDSSVLKSGQTEVRQITVTFKITGETRTYIATKAPMYDELGQLIGICGVSTDVTEQKRLEDHLAESRLLLEMVLNNVDANIYMKDALGRYLFANQRVLDTVHLTREQILGHTDADLFPAELAQAYKALDDQVFASGKPQQAEESFVDDAGNKHYYWSTKLLISDSDKHNLIGFSSEITPLKLAEIAAARSESRFRALFESSSEAIVLIAQSHFLDCNAMALTLMGVPSKAEFLKLTPGDLSPPHQPDGAISSQLAAKLIQQAFDQGCLQIEWVLKRFDNGKQSPIEAIITAIELDDGPALLVTMRDLTERKRYEEKINLLGTR